MNPPPGGEDASHDRMRSSPGEGDATPHRFSDGIPPVADPDEEAFFAGALRRIPRHLLLLTLGFLPFTLFRYGLLSAVGLAAGAFVSWLSFRSLTRGVQGLADRVVNAHSNERGGAIVARFFLRYLLVAVIAYGIFKSSTTAFRGFLWGLTLLVGALLLEAGYEGVLAFWR